MLNSIGYTETSFLLLVSNISSAGHVTQLPPMLADDISHVFVCIFRSNCLIKISKIRVFELLDKLCFMSRS